jgi:hypothetical protein
LIDDVMGGAATLPAAVFQCWVVVRLLVLLGFYLGIDKSQFFPQQMVQHLGLILNTKGAVRFKVPAKKLRAILHRVTEILGAGNTATMNWTKCCQYIANHCKLAKNNLPFLFPAKFFPIPHGKIGQTLARHFTSD